MCGEVVRRGGKLLADGILSKSGESIKVYYSKFGLPLGCICLL